MAIGNWVVLDSISRILTPGNTEDQDFQFVFPSKIGCKKFHGFSFPLVYPIRDPGWKCFFAGKNGTNSSTKPQTPNTPCGVDVCFFSWSCGLFTLFLEARNNQFKIDIWWFPTISHVKIQLRLFQARHWWAYCSSLYQASGDRSSCHVRMPYLCSWFTPSEV